MQTDSTRWYDQYPNLRRFIDKLEDLKKRKRDTIIHEMIRLIFEYDYKLIEKHILEFPIACRRWYDKEPDTWLVINALKYADEDLIYDIILYLKEKF